MDEPIVKISRTDNRTLTELEISGRFNADTLDELICRLGAHRRTSYPEIPKDVTEVVFDSSLAQVQPDPDLAIVAADNGISLWMRTDCFGWLAFDFAKSKAQALANLLHKAVRGDFPSGKALPLEPPGHRTH